MENLEKICFEVQRIAKIAGQFIAHERENFDIAAVEIKGKANFVSYVDKGAEELIINELRLLIPVSGFIAEEGTASSNGEKYQWVIDPLDGTTNFIHGFPPYAVSIALMENDDLIVGVVYEITHDECFYAWKGSKAYLNGKEIKVTEASTTEDALIATGFPYTAFEKLEGNISLMRHFMVNSHGLRRLGSAATDLAYLAAGRCEAFYEHGLKPWDVAAGTVIVRQAGGIVRDFNDNDNLLFKGEIVAANSAYYTEFAAVVQKYFNT